MIDDRSLRISGRSLDDDLTLTLSLKDGRVAAVQEDEGKRGDLFIAPGLVDLQVNGYGGCDFNDAKDGQEWEGDLAKVTRLLWGKGVTSYLPTVITNDPKITERNLARIAFARKADPLVAASVAGIHLEGPFISPEDGPRGAHPAGFVRPPDWDGFRRMQDAAEGLIVIVTISPEWPGSPEFIARCVDSGVKVAIGHTAATPDQIREAALAGASLSTHLGNGSHPMLPRHVNYIWQQLSEDGLSASLIADGFHLPDAVLKVFLRAKRGKAFLISDMVYLSGMEPGIYHTTIGGKVRLGGDGRISLADNPSILAGSAQTLVDGIGNLVRKGLATPAEAWAMASEGPAAYLGLPVREGMKVGAPGDLVLLEIRDGRFVVKKTYKDGALVHSAS